jgi:hypothetical protein
MYAKRKRLLVEREQPETASEREGTMDAQRLIYTLLIVMSLWVAGVVYGSDMQRVLVQTEVDDDHIIIVTEKGEQLLLEKWTLRFSPLVFEGKTFPAEISPMWVTIYIEGRDPIKWSVVKSLGYVAPRPSAPSAARVAPKKSVPAHKGSRVSPCEKGHWIDEVMGDGAVIELEDGSLWKVDDVDTVDSALWLPTTEIVVCDGKLINTEDHESVHAERVR